MTASGITACLKIFTVPFERYRQVCMHTKHIFAHVRIGIEIFA